MEGRLAEIPTAEEGDLSIDITPRELALDYLAHSFPTQLHELFSDADGNLQARPVFDLHGQPVQSREALERRERMIEHLAALPPVHGALDQIVQRFGAEQVAEVTGRSRRIVKHRSADGDRLCVEARPASANLAETAAFQDDAKRILVFSDAGGTGRSYHADLACENQRRRVHYLLEPGWKADAAIRAWAARTGPIRSSRRCSGRSPPTSRARSAFCPRSRAGSTRWARSPRVSARPAARACSGPTTTWRAPTPALRYDSSMPCSSPARSRV